MTTLLIEPASLARLVTWLAWVLLNTLWQGAAIAVLLWSTLRFVHETRSKVRYGLACVAMLAMAFAPLATGLALWDQPRAASAPADAVPVIVDVSQVTPSSDVEFSRPPATDSAVVLEPMLPHEVTSSDRVSTVALLRSFRSVVDRCAGLLVASWLIGVALSAGRLWSSFRAVRWLRRSATPVLDDSLLQTFARLIQRLNLNPGIRLMQSAAVGVPTVIGWLRPVVLLPIACLTGLSLEQIEALLAHELGHIKRHDYLINLLQHFVETVLFYHPCVWWISNIIRHEREYCCDAIALRLVSDRNLYANSLVKLATLATAPSQLALSASGGSLKDRIQRILNVPASASTTSGPVMALTMAFLLTLLFAATHLPRAGADDPKNDTPKPTTEAGKKDESNPAQSESKAVDAAAPQPAGKPAEADGKKRRNPGGGGAGGAEIFNVLEFELVQKELGLNEGTVEKIKGIKVLFQKELQSTLPTGGIRVRTTFPDGGGPIVTSQEATHEGMPVFKAAVAKFRPQLKDVLTADQYTRLLQITWQDMGTAAFSDDELIAALNITKEQQDKMSAIDDEYYIKRRELADQYGGPGAAVGARAMIPLQRERDAKIKESLSKEQSERFAVLKGRAFDLTQLRGLSLHRPYDSGRKAALLSFVENDSIQKELGFTSDETDKIKELTKEFRAALVEFERHEAKRELVDALSRLHFDKIVLDRLNSSVDIVSRHTIAEAERTHQGDIVAVGKAERTLSSLNFTEAEIDAVRQEARDNVEHNARASSTEERKMAREKARKTIEEANNAASAKSLAKLKETLTADQFTRLQQIDWQYIGDDALLDPEMIKELPVSKELQDKLKAIRADFDDKQKKVRSSAGEFRKKMLELDKEQDAKIDETLTKPQLDQFATLTGKELDLSKARMERARASVGQGQRQRQGQGQGEGPFTRTRAGRPGGSAGNNRRSIMVQERRRLLSLAENHGVQKELGLSAAEIDRIKSLGDDVRAAVREALGEPPDIEQMSPEERKKVIEEIEKVDQSVTEKFLRKVKEILTADQFTRLNQIGWQNFHALLEAEAIEALSLSKDQHEKLHAIYAEHFTRIDRQFYSVDINAIYANFAPLGNNAEERVQLREQHEAKINEVLTQEQQEKLAVLKGKAFDFRLLRQ